MGMWPILVEKLVTVSATLTAVCVWWGGHMHVAPINSWGEKADCDVDNFMCSVVAKEADLAVLLLLKLCFVAINKLLNPHLELL